MFDREDSAAGRQSSRYRRMCVYMAATHALWWMTDRRHTGRDQTQTGRLRQCPVSMAPRCLLTQTSSAHEQQPSQSVTI